MTDDSHTIPSTNCPVCGASLDRAATPGIQDENRKPRAGDACLCFTCGAPAIFTEGGQLRRPTAKEQMEIERDPEFQQARDKLMAFNRGRRQ